jgi:hypothetical protein
MKYLAPPTWWAMTLLAHAVLAQRGREIEKHLVCGVCQLRAPATQGGELGDQDRRLPNDRVDRRVDIRGAQSGTRPRPQLARELARSAPAAPKILRCDRYFRAVSRRSLRVERVPSRGGELSLRLLRHHSLIATTGCMRAARTAGSMPPRMPTSAATASAISRVSIAGWK